MDVYSGKLDKGLLQAYGNTDYHIFDPPLVLRTGRKNPCLEEFLSAQGATTYAFLTAFNPQSKQLTKDENEKRQNRLMAQTLEMGLPFRKGVGKGRDDEWPPEPSILILGISREQADTLAKTYGQLAYLYGEKGKKVKLIITE